jgi:hypothetical protein
MRFDDNTRDARVRERKRVFDAVGPSEGDPVESRRAEEEPSGTRRNTGECRRVRREIAPLATF